MKKGEEKSSNIKGPILICLMLCSKNMILLHSGGESDLCKREILSEGNSIKLIRVENREKNNINISALVLFFKLIVTLSYSLFLLFPFFKFIFCLVFPYKIFVFQCFNSFFAKLRNFSYYCSELIITKAMLRLLTRSNRYWKILTKQ